MDKEEAMKILKDFHDKSALFSVRTALETLYPELAESEDEKTRREIMEYITLYKDSLDDDEYKSWIAWLENIPYTIDHEKREGFHLGYKAALEKQGEQKPTWSEEDESLRLRTIGALETCKIGSPTKCVDEQINWLKSIKQRIRG